MSNYAFMILEVLEKGFGDGDSLAVSIQRFFSYKQVSSEGLLECSLTSSRYMTRYARWTKQSMTGRHTEGPAGTGSI